LRPTTGIGPVGCKKPDTTSNPKGSGVLRVKEKNEKVVPEEKEIFERETRFLEVPLGCLSFDRSFGVKERFPWERRRRGSGESISA